MREYDLRPYPVSSRSFSNNFAVKLLKYGTFCCVRCTARTMLDGFFPYLAQMITSISGCVTHKHIWRWPISSRSFSNTFAVKLLKYGTACHVCFTGHTVLDGFHIWEKWSLAWEGVSHAVSFDLVIQLSLCNKIPKIWHILSYLLFSPYISGRILSIFYPVVF